MDNNKKQTLTFSMDNSLEEIHISVNPLQEDNTEQTTNNTNNINNTNKSQIDENIKSLLEME